MRIELNQSILEQSENEEKWEEVFSELEERDELLCTGFACGADATFI